MSQVTNLKQALDSIAQQTKTTAGTLLAFRQKFQQSTQQVQSAISGSAQRKDQEVIQAIAQAQQRVDAAAQALEEAARIAKAYGESL